MAPLLSHQTASSVVASRTMNLSLGERPVWTPVSASKRAAFGDLRFAAHERLLVEGWRLEIPENPFEVAEADGFSALSLLKTPIVSTEDFS